MISQEFFWNLHALRLFLMSWLTCNLLMWPDLWIPSTRQHSIRNDTKGNQFLKWTALLFLRYIEYTVSVSWNRLLSTYILYIQMSLPMLSSRFWQIQSQILQTCSRWCPMNAADQPSQHGSIWRSVVIVTYQFQLQLNEEHCIREKTFASVYTIRCVYMIVAYSIICVIAFGITSRGLSSRVNCFKEIKCCS